MIGKSSVTNDRILATNAQIVSSVSENPRNVASFKENKVTKIAQQRHLHECNLNYVNADDILKGKLSKKLKQVKPKLKSETPEKNEILRMFEKIKRNSEHSKPQKTETVGACTVKDLNKMPNSRCEELADNSQFLKDHCKTGITFENSPKMKPKNRSKFQEIRSFFEANNGHSTTFLAHADSKVNLSINKSTQKNLSTNSTSGKICGDNQYIINPKSTDRNGLFPSTITPNGRSLDSQKVKISSSIVCSPNPRNSISPKSDYKRRKPSQKRISKGVLKKKDSLSSQPPITRFLGKKPIDEA